MSSFEGDDNVSHLLCQDHSTSSTLKEESLSMTKEELHESPSFLTNEMQPSETPLRIDDIVDKASSPATIGHDQLPSRRGKISRPSMKTSLPASGEIKSRLLTLADSSIITSSEFLMLVGYMPKYYRSCEFHLSYELKCDEVSLDSFYEKCSGDDVAACFILIEADDGHIFGGFMTGYIRKSDSFYGSKENFVFTIRPDLEVHRWTSFEEESEPTLKEKSDEIAGRLSDRYVPNSCDDAMCILSDESQFIIGGRDEFAIRLDRELNIGLSQKCRNFGSERLALADFFSIRNIEAWTLKKRPVESSASHSAKSEELNPVASGVYAVQSPNEVITLTKKSGTKCRAANPSSLNFSTKTPVKKGSHNALNVWKSDAAILIQSNWRAFNSHKRFRNVSLSAVIIQRVWRGHIVRNVHRIVSEESTIITPPQDESEKIITDVTVSEKDFEEESINETDVRNAKGALETVPGSE